jgi:hypothetical protein
MAAIAGYGLPCCIPPATSFHGEMREAMKNVHIRAIHNTFLNSLIEGNLHCAHVYLRYLCNLAVLHQALEEAQGKIIERYGDIGFIDPALYSSERIVHDIQVWARFTPSAKGFVDVDRSAFEAGIQKFVLPCTAQFIEELRKLENPITAVGSIFALYGTLMNGGVMVGEGVKKCFLARIDEAIDDIEHPPSIPLPVNEWKMGIAKEVMANPTVGEKYAKESATLFTVEAFSDKEKWRERLEDVPRRASLDEKAKRAIIQQCVATIELVLQFIDELEVGLSAITF